MNFRNAFPKAMVVYMHELLHQFGGDASRQFRAAILAMDHRILEEAEKLEDYEREWMETKIKLHGISGETVEKAEPGGHVSMSIWRLLWQKLCFFPKSREEEGMNRKKNVNTEGLYHFECQIEKDGE